VENSESAIIVTDDKETVTQKTNVGETKMTFQSTKVFDGYSTVFRQHKAEGTHCKYLHGYGVSFKVYFEGELDEKNWVWDFGGMKRAKGTIDGMNPKEWFDYMFDHTVIIATDDPEYETFQKLQAHDIIRLRVLEATGAERFAEFLYNKLNEFVKAETNGRVRVTQVEFREHEKNNAVYKEAN
jgi:6-pyruvoyltetrahydropterin/6-carboxytetrahydropterin synthase